MQATTSQLTSVVNHDFSAGIDVTGNITATGSATAASGTIANRPANVMRLKNAHMFWYIESNYKAPSSSNRNTFFSWPPPKPPSFPLCVNTR